MTQPPLQLLQTLPTARHGLGVSLSPCHLRDLVVDSGRAGCASPLPFSHLGLSRAKGSSSLDQFKARGDV
jgi:hypothetical protein